MTDTDRPVKVRNDSSARLGFQAFSPPNRPLEIQLGESEQSCEVLRQVLCLTRDRRDGLKARVVRGEVEVLNPEELDVALPANPVESVADRLKELEKAPIVAQRDDFTRLLSAMRDVVAAAEAGDDQQLESAVKHWKHVLAEEFLLEKDVAQEPCLHYVWRRRAPLPPICHERPELNAAFDELVRAFDVWAADPDKRLGVCQWSGCARIYRKERADQRYCSHTCRTRASEERKWG